MTTRKLKKVDIVCESLKKRIINNVWKVGNHIPTELELAEEFQCSRGTVSKAIARLEGLNLLEGRKRGGTRVTSNVIKQSSTSVDLDAFAFVFPNERHEGIRRMVRGFQDAAYASGRSVMMLTTGTDLRKETEVIASLPDYNVRGCVTSPVLSTVAGQLQFSQLAMASEIPIVLAGMTLPGTGCPSVTADFFHEGYTMTNYLIKQGLKRIGFLANHAWTQIAREKHLGYRKALEEAGIPYNPSLVHLAPQMTPSHEHPLREPSRIALGYLQQVENLEAVVCLYDFLAVALIETARSLNIRVPEDLKVVGIDDLSIANSDQISLTTYHVPFETIGQQAFALLNNLVTGVPLDNTEVQVRGELIVRKSA